MRGFAALPLIIVAIVIGVVGLGWYSYSSRQPAAVVASPSPSVTQSPTPSPTPTVAPTTKSSSAPLIDCIGPDGKHAQAPQSACDNLKKAWATPTPSPTATPAPTSSSSSSQSSGCPSGTDLASLTVSIQPQSGQSLVGDAAATISNGSGDCAGSDSRLPMIQVISQGSTSTSFSGFRPGKYHVQVGYHGQNYGTDVNLNSGTNSTTITVSN